MSVRETSAPRPVVFGEVLFDCFSSGERVLGGAPFNVAWHLQGFGLSPVFVSAVGADAAGDEVVATMRRHGMTTAGLQHDPRHATGQVRVEVADGQPSYDIVEQRAYDHVRADALPRLRAAVIYHGTLALREQTSADALRRLIVDTGAPVFIDVNLRSPWWRHDEVISWLRAARWAKVNDAELAALAGEQESPQVAARRLRAAHDLEQLVVTCGASGAFCIGRSGRLVAAGPVDNGPVVDTVGAGDAFAAVWIVGVLRGWSEDETLRRAQEFAARIVVQRGALIRDGAVYRSLRAAWNLG